jgi:hypothetical protein
MKQDTKLLPMIRQEQHLKLERPKPPARILGADRNIFNLLGIARKALKANGQRNAAEIMLVRVMEAKSYEKALSIICEYIEPVEARA